MTVRRTPQAEAILELRQAANGGAGAADDPPGWRWHRGGAVDGGGVGRGAGGGDPAGALGSGARVAFGVRGRVVVVDPWRRALGALWTERKGW